MHVYWDADHYKYPLLAGRWNNHTVSSRPSRQFKQVEVTESDSSVPSTHQWPWRGFAFASDLGTIGCLAKRPRLGLVGWLVATPYYLYSLFSQPKGKKRNEEIAYQVTANGIFPLIEAKLGIAAFDRLAAFFAKALPASQLARLPMPAFRILAGLSALAILTPTVGDPASKYVLSRYRQANEERMECFR